MSARQYRWMNAWLAVALLVLAMAPRAFTITPDGGRLLLPGGAAVPELCAVKRTTGRECGSCHLGRSVVLAAKGDFTRSVEHHAGGVILLGWVAVQALLRAILALTFARLARHWWVDLTITLASLAAAAVAVALL